MATTITFRQPRQWTDEDEAYVQAACAPQRAYDAASAAIEAKWRPFLTPCPNTDGMDRGQARKARNRWYTLLLSSDAHRAYTAELRAAMCAFHIAKGDPCIYCRQ